MRTREGGRINEMDSNKKPHKKLDFFIILGEERPKLKFLMVKKSSIV